LGGVLIALGMRPWAQVSVFYSWAAFVISTLVIATIASEFVRGGRVLQGKLNTNIFGAMYHLTRRNMRRYGGYVVHFGVVVIVVGIAGLAFNQDQEQEMGLNDTLKVGRYTLVGQEYTQDDNANYRSEAATLDVYRDGKYLTRLNPELRFFKASGGQPDHIVANHSTFREDLYVIYEGRNPDTGHPIIKAFVNPLVCWVWIGVFIVIFGTGLALVPNAAAVRAAVPASAMVSAGDQGLLTPVGASK
jgi:cytochrome c-type biogenesis protein CcmF